jgi:hypothetical protein
MLPATHLPRQQHSTAHMHVQRSPGHPLFYVVDTSLWPATRTYYGSSTAQTTITQATSRHTAQQCTIHTALQCTLPFHRLRQATLTSKLMHGQLLPPPQPALLRCCSAAPGLQGGLHEASPGCTATLAPASLLLLLLRPLWPWRVTPERTAAAAATSVPAASGVNCCLLTKLPVLFSGAGAAGAAWLMPSPPGALGPMSAANPGAAAAAAVCTCCLHSCGTGPTFARAAVAAAALGPAAAFLARSLAAKAGGSAAAAGMGPMLAVSQMAASRMHSDCLHYTQPQQNRGIRGGGKKS